MKLETLLLDIKQMFRRAIKFIIPMIILVFLLLLLFQWKSHALVEKKMTQDENMATITSTSFAFYIEDKLTGESFKNNYLMELILESDRYTGIIQEKTGVDFKSSIIKYYENYPDTKQGDPFKPFSSKRNTSTDVISFTINLFNKEDSQAVAEAYFALMQEADDSFFNTKDFYTLSEPTVLSDEPNNNVQGDMARDSSAISKKTILMSIILALVLGIIIGLGIEFLRALLNKRITYSYTVSWDPGMEYLNFTHVKADREKEIVYSLSQPKLDSKILLAEEEGDLAKYMAKESFAMCAQNLLDLDVSTPVEQFVILLKSGETAKAWFEQQLRLLENFSDAKVKIIHI